MFTEHRKAVAERILECINEATRAEQPEIRQRRRCERGGVHGRGRVRRMSRKRSGNGRQQPVIAVRDVTMRFPIPKRYREWVTHPLRARRVVTALEQASLEIQSGGPDRGDGSERSRERRRC